MHPYLVDLGFFQLRIYGLMIASGVMVATLILYNRALKRGLPWAEGIWELAFWAVIGGVAGARTWEVIWTWDYYRDHLLEIPAVWLGGISIQGAILGGLVAFLLWARKHRVNVWELLDLAAGPVVLAQGIGRIGCVFNGDAYGIPIANTWLPQWLGVVYAEGTPAHWVYGSTPLVPAEAFEGLADFAIAALLLFYRPRRDVPGWRPFAYGILYSLARFLLEFWRGDSLRTDGGLKAAQLLALVTILISAVALVWRFRSAAPAADAQG